MKFRETQEKRLVEASGTYHGKLFLLPNVDMAVLFGVDIGWNKLKYAKEDAGIFIKDEDLKKLNRHLVNNMKSTDGEWDFATDEFTSDKKLKRGGKGR